ncbi:MmcQ/YjbR family DNA-binding protein [soil metagenome]
MNADELRRLCTSMPNSVEDFPFHPETSVFRLKPKEGTKGKIFAISTLGDDPLTVSLKIDPELGESLRATYESIAPGYHLNKRHWVTITLNGDADDEIVRGLIEDSHALVAPKRKTKPSR